MLVLAMEFSKGAQRAFRTSVATLKTGHRVRDARASGRRRLEVVPASRWRVDSPRAACTAGSEGRSLKTE